MCLALSISVEPTGFRGGSSVLFYISIQKTAVRLEPLAAIARSITIWVTIFAILAAVYLVLPFLNYELTVSRSGQIHGQKLPSTLLRLLNYINVKAALYNT